MFWKTRIIDDSLTANGNKLRTYRNLKEKYETDTYLFLDIDKTLIKQFTQIKISNSNLMIELGRHNKIDINNRMCTVWKNGVEDEYHFIILIPICSKFISVSSHTVIKNSSFPEHIKIFSQFFINCVKKSLVRKSTLIIPNMGEMKLIQRYFDPCCKAVGLY
jgi:hypothetical protein